MRLIRPYFNVVGECPLVPEDALQHIEAAGRTCYKSEDKITEKSARGFCVSMGKSQHHSVIEHSNLVIRTLEKPKRPNQLAEQIMIGLGERMTYHKVQVHNGHVYVAGNYRAWFQTMEKISRNAHHVVHQMVLLAMSKIGFIFGMEEFEITATQDDNVKMVTDSAEIPDRMRAYMVRIVCDRGVTHEIVRHRPFAYSQESTRYVNYLNKGIEFIIPCWFSPDFQEKGDTQALKFREMSSMEYRWCASMLDAVFAYQGMVDKENPDHWKPQQARSVLPNSLKTEIVMTGYKEEWQWFFHMRTPAAAHPQMREIAVPLQEVFFANGWI